MKYRLFLLVLLALPFTALADLSQTVTLSTSAQSNLSLDTGATSTSGGDIQWSASGVTPQGSATAVNELTLTTQAGFDGISSLVVQLFPGYSKSAIPATTAKTSDVFFVHSNGGHYAKLFVTAQTGATITLEFTTFGVASTTTGGPPTITSIKNNSSGIPSGFPNSGIAPSSIFVIAGTGLADAGTPTLQSSASPGIPLTLNGASISVTVNGVTTHPGIYYTSPTQIAAVLPAATPIGTGTLTVTYNATASNAAAIKVVAAAPGINTYNTNTGVATDAVTGAILTYANSGTPGETIVLWATGLGADPSDSDTVFSAAPHAVSTPLQIYVGGVPATILYQGSAGYPGVNQINLTIPSTTPNGCWITVAAVAGAVLSNVATLPINADGGACVDSLTGLSGSQIAPSGSQTLRTGLVDIVQTKSSTNTNAAFQKYTGIYAPSNSVSPGGCIVNNLTAATIGSIDGLDPGTITLTGPTATAVTLATQLGIKGAFSATLTTIPQSGGTYVFKGSGGADVGSFTSSVTFANPLLTWTNPDVAATVDRSQPLTITWSGGNPGTYIFITGTSTVAGSNPSLSAAYTCLTTADAGKFTVPAYILSALPAGSGGTLVQNDIYGTLAATGIDIGITLGEVSANVATKYN